MPAQQLRRVLGREYGAGWERRFAAFDDEPVAAASIGQVHRATAADGRELALKIQYPGVARSIDSDVDNVAALLRLLNLLPVELDVDGLAARGQAAARAGGRLPRRGALPRALRGAGGRRAGAARAARAPRPDDAAHHGDGLRRGRAARGARRRAAGPAQRGRQRCSSACCSASCSSSASCRPIPNFANYLYQPDSGRVVLLDFGATRSFAADFVGRLRAHHPRRDRRRPRRRRARGAAHRLRAADDAPERIAAVVDVCFLVCEPLRHAGRYDFGPSDLPARVRDLGLELAFRQRLLRPPPPRDDVPAPQARRLVPAARAHRRAGRRAGAGAAVPAAAMRGSVSG